MPFTLGCSHPSFTLPWRILLVHFTALHLLHQGSAQLTVVAPDLHVTAIVGQDVVLRCQLSPCKNAWSSDIRWIQHQSSGLVHHYEDGEDLEQMEEYKGRTELLRDGLSDGNLDLRITAVRSSDSGWYSCIVQEGDDYAGVVMELEVSDPFSQIVHPWKVALAVVVTLLLGSSFVNVFLYRKKVAQSRELTRKDAKLAEQAETLEERDATLEQQAAELEGKKKEVENLKSQLKKHSDEMDLSAADLTKQVGKLDSSAALLKRLAANLVDRTKALVGTSEVVEKENSQLKKDCEQMGSSAAHLKIQAAKLAIHCEKKDLSAADLNKLAANLVEQTEEVAQRSEAVEKQNSHMRKQYEEMDLSTADLKIIAGKLDLSAADLKKHVAELAKRAEAVEKGNSVLKEHCKDMVGRTEKSEMPPEGSDREMDCSSQ